MRIECPQSVEGTVTEFDLGFVHQFAQFQVGSGLVHGRHGRQGERAKLLLMDGGVAQGLDPRYIVEIGQRFGREETDLCIGALQAGQEGLDTRRTESLEFHGRDAGGFGIEQLLAPGRGATGPQLGTIDHGQELGDAEEMLLVLMVKLGYIKHEVTGGLRGRHAFLVSLFKLVKSLIDDGFQHLGSAETLPVLFDHERERIFFLDLAPTQDTANLGIVGLGGRADHHRSLGERHVEALLGSASGKQDFAQTGHHQVAAGEAFGAACWRHFNLDVQPVGRIDADGNRQAHDHH